MTKADIVEKIYDKLKLPKGDLLKIVDSTFQLMSETLRNENRLKISGFGNFYARSKRTRRGRNPQTGDDLVIGPRRVVSFKTSPVFRERLNSVQNHDSGDHL